MPAHLDKRSKTLLREAMLTLASTPPYPPRLGGGRGG